MQSEHGESVYSHESQQICKILPQLLAGARDVGYVFNHDSAGDLNSRRGRKSAERGTPCGPSTLVTAR